MVAIGTTFAPMGGGRSLTSEESHRLQVAIRELLARHGTQTAVAERLQVTQQALSTILAGVSRGSYAMARTVARALGRPVEQLLSGSLGADGGPWSTLPGWNPALEQARAMFPRTSADAWEWLGTLSGVPPPGLPPVALALIASAYDHAHQDHTAPQERTSAEASGMRKKFSR